jgi:4-hydroxy-tetrahydrodipicolinate reductase
MIKVALCGACGRMGRLLVRMISGQPDMELVAAIDAPNTPEAGNDVGKLAGVDDMGVKIVGAEHLDKVLHQEKPDVLVDFTNSEAAIQNVRIAAQNGVGVVVGTTGFTEKQWAEIAGIVQKNIISAVVAPNMSVGVNVFFKLVEDAARSLGKDYDVEIVEAHHVHKIDAPSGTALRAAEIIAKEFGQGSESIKFGRPAGKQPRAKGDIHIHSVRAGEIVGEHVVTFAAPGERVEIVHKAQSRETFATGVLKAISHIAKKSKPGVVQDMQNVLGLRA